MLLSCSYDMSYVITFDIWEVSIMSSCVLLSWKKTISRGNLSFFFFYFFSLFFPTLYQCFLSVLTFQTKSLLFLFNLTLSKRQKQEFIRLLQNREKQRKKKTRQVSLMIHLARPTVSPSPEVSIVFAWNLFCFARFWKLCMYVRRDGRDGHVRKQWSLPDVTVDRPNGSTRHSQKIDHFESWNKKLWKCQSAESLECEICQLNARSIYFWTHF